jgi:hypothetical protein
LRYGLRHGLRTEGLEVQRGGSGNAKAEHEGLEVWLEGLEVWLEDRGTEGRLREHPPRRQQRRRRQQ